MRRSIPFMAFGFIICRCQLAHAAGMVDYGLIQDSSFFILSLGCIVVSGLIFQTLRGGSLATPWMFIIGGFVLAGISAAIHIFDIMKIVIYQYDLRLAMLALQTGSMLLLLIGLVLYKKGLQ